MLPQNFIAIDVETTGLDAEKDESKDIALVHFKNGNIATSIDF
jgi:DNA polymerase III epsilon subunit-like protein